ncbi:UBN2_3 domain-containing protein, partial [Cephalotus follicularis]
LLSWLLSSLTVSVHAQVVGLYTSRSVWQFLTSAFASQSQARIMQLHLSLHSLKKGSNSMATYLLKAKSIADELVMDSKPISEDDLVFYCRIKNNKTEKKLKLKGEERDEAEACFFLI